jgi:hypothetical protein
MARRKLVGFGALGEPVGKQFAVGFGGGIEGAVGTVGSATGRMAVIASGAMSILTGGFTRTAGAASALAVNANASMGSIGGAAVGVGGRLRSLSGIIGGVRQKLLGFGALGVQAAQQFVTGMAAPLMGMGGLISAALGPVGLVIAGLAAIVSGIIHCTFAAADFGESLDKVETIFGTSSKVILAEASKMAAQFGTVKKDFVDAAANFGSVFKEMGLGAARAAELGNAMTKLGMDMASLDNVADTEVFTAMSAALRGEFDPLERFRVFLNADTVALKAVKMGLANTTQGVSEAARKYATLQLIVEKTKDAQGNLEQTFDSGKNQWKALGGNISNIATSLGEVFLPMMSQALGGINTFLSAIAQTFEWVSGVFQNVYKWIGLVDETAAEVKMRKKDQENAEAQKSRLEASGAPRGGGEGGGKGEGGGRKGWSGGLEEYAKKIQESAWGKGKEKKNKTDELLTKQNDISQKILDKLGGGPPKVVPVAG